MSLQKPECDETPFRKAVDVHFILVMQLAASLCKFCHSYMPNPVHYMRAKKYLLSHGSNSKKTELFFYYFFLFLISDF